MERPRNFDHNRRPSRGFRRAAALACGASPEFYSQSTTLAWSSAGGGAGTLSFFGILFVINNSVVVFGGQRRWRMSVPRIPLAMDDSWFSAAGGDGTWSVLGILIIVDDPLVVFGGRRRWRVERPRNSVRNQRPSRDFLRTAALARGASSEFCSHDPLVVSGGAAPARAMEHILRFLFGIDNPLVVLGGRAVLARGASSDFYSESTTLSLFWAGGGAACEAFSEILYSIAYTRESTVFKT